MLSNKGSGSMLCPVSQWFAGIDMLKDWCNWNWQQHNAIQSIDGLLRLFPNMGPSDVEAITRCTNHVRFKVTPYMLSLVRVDENMNPLCDDPIWCQFMPCPDILQDLPAHVADLEENWELPGDMVTPILQHKYKNRVNLRIQNSCLGYCMYCFEAKRVLDRTQPKGSFNDESFNRSLEYIQAHDEVEEVVISGGEPLVLSNERLEDILFRIREIRRVRAIRIQTRAFVHNPFRVDDELVDLLVKYNVNAMGVHISHPAEITDTFKEALARLSDHKCRTILLGQIPLLKGVNDNEDVMVRLLIEMYTVGIKPYYLIHALPHTLGASKYRPSVRTGVRIMQAIRRNISNPAVPEYIIVHAQGKHTVPIELEGTNEFKYLQGHVEFLNWKGEWCRYEDA